MAEETIYSASGDVARRDDATIKVTRKRGPQTEYVYAGNRGGRAGRMWSYTPQNKVTQPSYGPKFLGDSSIIAYAWIAAMILVGFDEWHNNGILPRPARLWDTSIVYGLLALAAFIPPLTPLANALAIGYSIVLLWQYYNKRGQFANG